MPYSNILVLGGTGFIGSHLIAQLAAQGRHVIVPTRRAVRARHLAVLPTVEIVVADINQDAALAALMRRADAVINLVGILHSRPGVGTASYGPDFAKAHVELPIRVVAACGVAGVKRSLHMSALGANRTAPSMYLRSKAAGEDAALSHPAVATTVFRPSVVFGEDDAFLNMFAKLQSVFPVFPLGGADARFQPIYVGDVVQAFVNALDNPHTFGKVYELAGPTIYTLRELVQLAGRYSGHPRPVLALPPALARLQAFMLEWVPGGPVMSRDNLDSMKVDNVAHGPIAPELGIKPEALEAIASRYLGEAAGRSHFDQYRIRAKR
ncbi:complex I NDUFA9 subunit family protein [Actimicrobium antarcticum]|uniref:complex I NDUFA9 subunit family protein n=1 Tax=Actimicrobium antarcticum TaxID=1051899 RepID=UPI003CD099B3